MTKLLKRFDFNWRKIQFEDPYHIEYSVTDICNKNCAACSHLAPLAKLPNFVEVNEFTKVTGIIRKLIPDAHTFWLTGGELTLHPDFIRLLELLSEIYSDTYIGIYSNGITLQKYTEDKNFWAFMKEAGIVWAITNYDSNPQYFENLFSRHGCINNLAIIQSGRVFSNLVNYSQNQPVSMEKYVKCGWEKSKINIRNGKIYNCPSSEFADLFNVYFDVSLKISKNDYLVVNEHLTRKQIEEFRGPSPFCSQCDLSNRYKKVFKNRISGKSITEWSNFNEINMKNKYIGEEK